METAPPRVSRHVHAGPAEAGAATEPSPPRLKDAARTRARILEAAQKVFAIHGFTHAGMRGIAAEAGVNVALVARYFGSKERLFEAALDGLLTDELWAHPREIFGVSVVSHFVDGVRAKPNPLPMLTQAAADPVSQSLAVGLIRTRVLAPLAEWLGPPRDEARAAEILALCAGFFTYRIMIPLDCFSGPLQPATRSWLEEALQAIVDDRPRPPRPG